MQQKKEATPKERAKTLQRTEMRRVVELLSSALIEQGERLVVYREGYSDKTVAESLTKFSKKDISPVVVARFRVQTYGRLPTEGRPSAELLTDLIRRLDAMSGQYSELRRRVDSVEKDLYNDPTEAHSSSTHVSSPSPKPVANGHHRN